MLLVHIISNVNARKRTQTEHKRTPTIAGDRPRNKQTNEQMQTVRERRERPKWRHLQVRVNALCANALCVGPVPVRHSPESTAYSCTAVQVSLCNSLATHWSLLVAGSGGEHRAALIGRTFGGGWVAISDRQDRRRWRGHSWGGVMIGNQRHWLGHSQISTTPGADESTSTSTTVLLNCCCTMCP